jgi:hypothetical protein
MPIPEEKRLKKINSFEELGDYAKDMIEHRHQSRAETVKGLDLKHLQKLDLLKFLNRTIEHAVKD